MVCVSSKGAYGLAAMLYLAQNRDRLVQIKDIAKSGDIPQNYLEQLLVQLKKAGFVESIRGARGGYRLAADPKELTVFQILGALEGDLVNCDKYTTASRTLNHFWAETSRKVEQAFEVSLQELVDRSLKLDEAVMYHI
ncbi:MAG: Rrf2 family transcriptional regulator [Campylobacterales bacterium]